MNRTAGRICLRSLSESEKNYAQIEKELLRRALEKFHHYIYGKEVTIQSEHKPLEGIVKKPISHSELLGCFRHSQHASDVS